MLAEFGAMMILLVLLAFVLISFYLSLDDGNPVLALLGLALLGGIFLMLGGYC